jgi:hypothetical protein
MRSLRLSAAVAAFVACFAALAGPLRLAVVSGETVANCSNFETQAGAQTYFLAAGGSPARAVGSLDPDRDGVACETLPRPYAGYATIGYNRKRGFLFGVATMPARAGGGYACLYGNAAETGGIRRVRLFRGSPGHGSRLAGDDVSPAEAEPGSGRLLWKLDRPSLPRGSYYASFEGRYWPHPGGSSECPAFSSRPTELPAARGSR